ncbi:MAG: tetratricopeptide repeat protein, partial [Acidimicrobiia bacterium]
MAVSVRALADKGRGRAARPSPLRALVVAAVVGLGLARFLLATPDVAQPPPLRPATTAEALALLRESVVSDPADSAAWLELGLTLVQAASETGDPSFYPQAENALNAAKALAREDAASRVGLAVLALARHDFHAAESAASDLVADDPFNAQALVVLVDAEIELGRYESAGDHLQQLLDVRPALPALAHTS